MAEKGVEEQVLAMERLRFDGGQVLIDDVFDIASALFRVT